MPEYAAFMFYRTRELPASWDANLIGDPEFWDGQIRVPFTTDRPLGEDEKTIVQELQDIQREVGRKNGYIATTISRSSETGRLLIEDLNDGE